MSAVDVQFNCMPRLIDVTHSKMKQIIISRHSIIDQGGWNKKRIYRRCCSVLPRKLIFNRLTGDYTRAGDDLYICSFTLNRRGYNASGFVWLPVKKGGEHTRTCKPYRYLVLCTRVSLVKIYKYYIYIINIHRHTHRDTCKHSVRLMCSSITLRPINKFSSMKKVGYSKGGERYLICSRFVAQERIPTFARLDFACRDILKEIASTYNPIC